MGGRVYKGLTLIENPYDKVSHLNVTQAVGEQTDTSTVVVVVVVVVGGGGGGGWWWLVVVGGGGGNSYIYFWVCLFVLNDRCKDL
jgi:hypothetical protein